MSKGVPYIRLFVDDWLSGTSELSLEERGALDTITAITGATGRPPAYDLDRLSRRFGCTKGKAKKVLKSLEDLGKVSISGGVVTCDRAMEETKIAQKNSQKQTEKANARWAKSGGKPNKINTHPDATGMPRECQPEPEPYIDDDDRARGDFDREKILLAMGHDKSGLTSSGKIIGNQNDMLAMRAWKTELGLSISEIEEVIKHITAYLSNQGRPPPVSFKYYTKAMQELAGNKNAPKLKPINGGTNYAKPANKSKSRVNAFVSGARGTP